MRILLLGINFYPELTGIGKYSGEMVESLVNLGHEVTVITALPYYPDWIVPDAYRKWAYKSETLFGAKVIRCPLYVPGNPNTKNRLLHLLSFALTSFCALFSQIFKKNDVIITVVPTFFCTPAALLFAKITGVKSSLHIQDYEIDAMFGLGMADSVGFAKTLIFKIESWVMRRFDSVSTISRSMLKLAENNKKVAVEKLVFFPNWADVDFVHPEPDNYFFREKWHLSPNDFVVMYSGNLGKKQGLEIVLDAARHFISQHHVKFIIVGEGAHRAQLEKLAEGLPNVFFKPLQPYQDLSKMLAAANIHLVIQKKGAADLVFPSKLTNILAAGAYSIITAENETELGEFCNNNPGIALRIEPENLQELIRSIQYYLGALPQMGRINQSARTYAESFINKEAVLRRYEQDLLSLIREN